SAATPITTLVVHAPLSHILCSFFSRSVPHRPLHSFPTRRSSDLNVGEQFAQLLAARGLFYHLRCAERQCVGGLFGAGDDIDRDRSEEHTSELQSRENLVCRLLLEKKNKTCGSTRHD